MMAAKQRIEVHEQISRCCKREHLKSLSRQRLRASLPAMFVNMVALAPDYQLAPKVPEGRKPNSPIRQ